MIQREATSSVADIKAALASPTTCDSSTYEALTTFLTFSAGPTSDQSLDSQRKNEGIPLATKQRFAKATQARVKKEPGLKIKETHLEYIPPRISSAEKVRLATEVVNIGLKALTATVKKVASTNLDAHLKHQDRISGSRSVEQPLASTALSHDRLANRQTQKPAANSGIKKSFPNTASTPPGTWIAECTKLALATLRRPSEGTNGDIKLPPFQIEMGMSAFIGKLIALDMLDTASKELKVLMHRICVKRTKEQMVSEEVSSECLDSKTGKLILADLLRMSTIPDNPQALSLLISSHIHILKILGLRRRPGGIEQAFEHIQLSSNVSPVNAIEQSIQKNSPEARAKATNQFETLARSISSLTPSLSLSEDARAVDNRISASPYHCLNLFMLSLQIKWKAWLLSNHQIDLRREVFEPFRSAIQAFNRRAKFEPKAKIEAIKAASQILSNLMTLGASSYLNSHDYSRSRIDTYKVLSEIAREGQDLDASLRWMSASLQLLNETNPSDAKRASLLCQLGSLELRKSLEEPNSEYTGIFVQDAISSLKGNFQGTSLELDELLKAVSSFRKSATLVALESTRSPNVDKKPRNGLENLCRQIVILGLRFMIRFLGKEPGPASQDSAVSRYQQRLELCIKVGRPTIEAVIALARLPSSFEEDVMRSIEDALIDCAQLASQLEPRGTSMRTSPEKSDRHSIWVLLSNVYWSRYLDMKRKGVGSSKLIQMVHSSVEYLLDCSPSEQETAFFSAKAETLGLLFDTSRDWQKAMQYYARSLNHMIEGGILCAMRGNAVSLPLLRVISEGQTVSPFNRILTAYTKALSQAIVEGDRVALFFDDQKLHPEERGIFLEAQLATLIAAKNHCPSPRATSVSKLIVENLLELFNQEDYPIRRLRVVSRIMRFHLIDSTIFEPNFIAELASENPKSSPGNDVGLEKFRSHIGGCRDAWFALSHGNAKLDLLKSTLVTWSSIFSNEQDWKAIQERVDDISEWITLLDSIADLFHMQGFELERASALNFAATACKLQPSASSANCVSKLSALGLQLSRLGHSRDSGKTLQKARQIIDSTDIPIMVRLQWHLAYAEYLIEIGNLAKAEDYVERAKDLFAATLETALRPASSKDQYNQTWIAGELMHVLSIRAIARGRSAHAIYFARKSIRMTSRAWALLDHRIANGKGTGNDSSKNSLEAITGNIMSMSISAPGPFPVMSTKHESLKSYPFWPLVPRLFHRLLHVSALLSHEGLLPEAQFYASRAAKISEAVQAHHLRASILTTQGGYNVNGGDLSRGVEELKEADGIVADLAPTLTNVRLQLNLASAYANLQEDDEERGALQAANKILQTLLFAVFIGKQPQPSRAVDEIAEQIQSLNLDEKLDKPKPRARAKTVGVRLPKKAPVKAPMKVEPKQLEPPESPATERSPLLQMRGQVLRQSAESELRKGMFDSAQTHLRDAEQLPLSSKTSILQALGVARLLLRQGLDGLLTDPVFNVLQESTISCPSAGPAGRRASRDLGKQQAGKPDSQGRARKGRPAKRVIESQIVPTHAFTRVLCECLEKLNANHELAQSNGTSSMTHKVTDALSKTLMMLSAACSTDPSINISPAFTAYAMGEWPPLSMVKVRR